MLIIKHPYSLNEIVSALQAANPSRKQSHAASLKLWLKYEQLITQEIQRGILFATKDMIKNNTLCLPWEKLYYKLGKCRAFYYFPWLHLHFPLVEIIHKGNNLSGLLTMVKPLYEIEVQELEIAAVSSSAKDAFDTMYRDYFTDLTQWDNSGYSSDIADWVPIDTNSLASFIKHNLKNSETATDVKYISTLKRNLVWAQTLLLCATHFKNLFIAAGANPVAGIPQIVNESEFGRRYYKGLNLQNAPKIVRHAALGNCYQYDLDASVFAWRFTEVKAIDPSIKLPCTMEMLDQKTALRKQLANALKLKLPYNKKIELIKQLLTAIGFGSRMSNNGVSWTDSGGTRHYPSINKIIMNPQARKELLAHPWLAEFIEEQKLISKVIFDYYKANLDHIAEIKNPQGNISSNKALAYLYQHAERDYIEQLSRQAKEQGNFLLLVHDGFYTKTPVKIVELKEQLKELNPEANISCEQHTAWSYDDSVAAHRELIYQEELKANDGFIPANVLANYQQILHKFDRKEYNGADEYDNGNRIESKYDIELDPFYMEE